MPNVRAAACAPTPPQVTLADASSYTARVVGWDASKDVAVLRLSMPKSKLKELKPVQLPAVQGAAGGGGKAGAAGSAGGEGGASSSGLVVGQSVFCVGNVTGLDHTLTRVRACLCVCTRTCTHAASAQPAPACAHPRPLCRCTPRTRPTRPHRIMHHLRPSLAPTTTHAPDTHNRRAA